MTTTIRRQRPVRYPIRFQCPITAETAAQIAQIAADRIEEALRGR